MTLQRRVHPSIQTLELPRILADQVRREHRDSGADAFGIGRQISGPEGTDFTVADDPSVGLDPDEGRVEDRDRFAAGPVVAAFVQRELDPIGGDSPNFHGPEL
jgi:hypothetical protein